MPESGLLLLLDFDGTLAPLRRDPDRVRIPPAVRACLRRLARAATVAVISGRSLPDLRRRVGLPGLIYAGNHGLDIAGAGLRLRRGASARPRLRRLARRLERELSPLGARVEDKGLTLSVHHRGVPPRRRAAARRALDRLAGDFRVRAGKKVWEVLPEPRWDKGRAALWILRRRPGLAVAIGDDTTDEDMFRALGRRGFCVKVGPGPTSAGYRVRGIREAGLFLDRIAAATAAAQRKTTADIKTTRRRRAAARAPAAA